MPFLMEFTHPNIMQILDFDFLEKDINSYLIASAFEFGDLSLKDQLDDGKKFSDNEILGLLWELSDALNYVNQTFGIAHANLKSSNIILSQGSYKMSEFGKTQELRNKIRSNTPCWSLNMAPEYRLSEVASQATEDLLRLDVYSLGIVAAELLGLNLKKLEARRDTIKAFANIIQEMLEGGDLKYGADLNGLLKEMLSTNPKERPSISKVAHSLYELCNKRGFDPAELRQSRIAKVKHQLENEGKLVKRTKQQEIQKLFIQGYQAHLGGKYKESIEFYEKQLALLIENKSNQIEIAKAYSSLSVSFKNIGDYKKSVDLQTKALEIRKTVFGEIHAHVAESLSNLGVTYQAIGEYQKALECNEKALDIRKQIQKDNSLEISVLLNNNGAIYRQIGKYEAAKEALEKALEIKSKLLGMEHVDTARTLNNLGLVELQLQNIEKALDYLKQALRIRIKKYQAEHPEIAQSLNNIGVIYWQRNDAKNALEYLKRGLEMKRKFLGEKHPEIALAMNNIGLAYMQEKDLETALGYFQRSLEMRKEIFGEDHPDVGQSLVNIAAIYQEKGDGETCIKYYKEAIEIKKKKYGPSHPEIAAALLNIGIAYHKKHEYEQALKCYEAALAMYKMFFADDHRQVQKCVANIQAIEARMKSPAKKI